MPLCSAPSLILQVGRCQYLNLKSVNIQRPLYTELADDHGSKQLNNLQGPGRPARGQQQAQALLGKMQSGHHLTWAYSCTAPSI